MVQVERVKKVTKEPFSGINQQLNLPAIDDLDRFRSEEEHPVLTNLLAVPALDDLTELNVVINGKRCKVTVLQWQGYEADTEVKDHCEPPNDSDLLNQVFELYWQAAGAVNATNAGQEIQIRSQLSEADFLQHSWRIEPVAADQSIYIIGAKDGKEVFRLQPAVIVNPGDAHSTKAIEGGDGRAWILAMKARVIEQVESNQT